MKNKFKRIHFYILLGLIFLITLGYAYLTNTLNINGLSTINSPKWDVHFENIVIKSGSVSGDYVTQEPEIETDTSIVFGVRLSKPGDYYEFTVDVVNEGSLDAMIASVESYYNGIEIEQLPIYLNYSVTYSDGARISEHHSLDINQTEKLLLRVEYNKDISANDLLNESNSFEMSFSLEYVQKDDSAINRGHVGNLYDTLEDEFLTGNLVGKYTGSHQDTMAGNGNKEIYYWKADTSSDASLVFKKINVIFAGYCWEMIRTTDTGGVKMLYNGKAHSTNTCSGGYSSIGSSSFNTNDNSPAYVGYMYNPNTSVYYVGNAQASSGSLYGTGVTYSNGLYTLSNTDTIYNGYRHYSCNNASGVCSKVRYYFNNDGYEYVELTDGRNIEEALADMLYSDNVNSTNSTIKNVVDSWYRANLSNYSSYIEDVIYCNDRSIIKLGGWNPTNPESTDLQFNSYTRNGDLSCVNETDRFSVSNPKAKLTYPIGLLTVPEKLLQNKFYFGGDFWLSSPFAFGKSGIAYNNGYNGLNFSVKSTSEEKLVIPVISLKPGTRYIDGDGSSTNPYIIER